MTDLEEAIRRLAKEATQSERSEIREAAHATGGVPAFIGAGGVYVVTPELAVLHFDPETGIATEADEFWRRIAHIQAAKKYPSLESLLPTRPTEAVDCPNCNGTGRVLIFAICGECAGTGWQDTPAAPV